MATVIPVTAEYGSQKIATPKNFLNVNITGSAVTVNPDGTLTIAIPAPPPAVAVSGLYRNLVLQNSVANPDSAVDVAVDEVTLRDSTSGLVYLAQNVSVSTNLAATVGAPGALDTGVEAANTWYHVWLIYNGTTVAALFSVSLTAPVLPSGYTFKARVGSVRNDSGSNLVRMAQLDNFVQVPEVVIFGNKNAAVADTFEILSGAELTAFRSVVPPTARICSGTFGSQQTGGSQMSVSPCDSSGAVSAVGAGVVHCVGAVGGAAHAGFICSTSFAIMVRGGPSAYNMQWKARVTSGLTNKVAISGFTL